MGPAVVTHDHTFLCLSAGQSSTTSSSSYRDSMGAAHFEHSADQGPGTPPPFPKARTWHLLIVPGSSCLAGPVICIILACLESPCHSLLMQDCKACSGAVHLMTSFQRMTGTHTSNTAAPPPGQPSSTSPILPAVALEAAAERLPCPPQTAELGRSTWTFLHTMAAYYPEEPSGASFLLIFDAHPTLNIKIFQVRWMVHEWASHCKEIEPNWLKEAPRRASWRARAVRGA